MKRGTVVGLIVGIGVLGGLGIAGWFQYARAHFVTTDYAYVSAPAVWVKAPTLGTISAVDVASGASVAKGATMAVLTTPHGRRDALKAPMAGGIGPLAIAAGQVVLPGQKLLSVVSLNHFTVIAEVPETDLHRVFLHQQADLWFSGAPRQEQLGQVERIGKATLGQYSPLLSVGTFSKAVQWVPVEIRIEATGLKLVAGESVTVQIIRQGG